MKNHAASEDTSCPIGHHTESSVRRELEASGRNSRNKAPSTGRFPPTPKPNAAYRKHTAPQLLPYAARMPKTLVMSSVMLKAIRRPKTSDPIPHRKLPRERPTKQELVVYLTVFSGISNSADSDGRVSETPYIVVSVVCKPVATFTCVLVTINCRSYVSQLVSYIITDRI